MLGEVFPKAVKNLEFLSGYYYDRIDGNQGFIRVGTSSSSRDIWLYDYYHGWVKVTEADIDLLEKHVPDRESILLKIYKRAKH